MILLTSNRASREPLDARRAHWEQCAPTADLTDRDGRHDRYSAALSNGTADPGLLERATNALLRYDIYPPKRMRGLVCTSDRRVRDGALIIQRISLGPTVAEAAVRVVDVFGSRDPGQVIGFSYVTLEGHAERGVATFFISQDNAGRLAINIESWSRPGGGIATLVAPISRVLQKRFTAEALAYFGQAIAIS